MRPGGVTMDVLIHSANVIYLVSYVMRDILWLRIFTVVAASCLIFYFCFRPEPLLAPVYWNLLFIALNLYWIVRLLLERRPVRLTEEEQELCRLVFGTVTPREMINLLKLGVWKDAEIDECFVARGSNLDQLMLIHSGSACFEMDGRKLQVLKPGQFIGSISFITDETAPANVIALEPTRYVCWPKSTLKSYLTKNPELHAAIQTTLGIDLTKRLQDSWTPT
jgi:hypothetical protein